MWMDSDSVETVIFYVNANESNKQCVEGLILLLQKWEMVSKERYGMGACSFCNITLFSQKRIEQSSSHQQT